VQCALVSSGGKILHTLRGSGDVVDILITLVSELCTSGFKDKLGIIYCYGPGSTLGLRSALTAINVWLRFSQEKLKVYCYSSLSMAKCLAQSGIVVYCGVGKFVVETLGNETIVTDSLDEYRKDFYFLNTRRVLPETALGMNFVDYDLEHFGGNIFEIANEVEIPSVFEIGERKFAKWPSGRPCKCDI
jgi:hypothetical protein